MQRRSTARRFVRKPLALALASAALLGVPALFMQAQAQSASAATERELPAIYVIGKDQGAALRQPGAVALVGIEELQLRQPRSTEEMLRTVPGVTVKPEEESAIVAEITIICRRPCAHFNREGNHESHSSI